LRNIPAEKGDRQSEFDTAAIRAAKSQQRFELDLPPKRCVFAPQVG
jgi:hypothetical protein